MAKSTWLSLISAAVLSGAPFARSQDQGYVAQVVLVIEQIADAATLQSLTPENRANLAAAGIDVDDQARALRTRPRPLAGYYVTIGQQRYPTDDRGFLHLPKAPAVITNLKIYAQVYDTKVFGTLPRLIVVPEGQVPAPSTLKLSFKRPPSTPNPVGLIANSRTASPGIAITDTCSSPGDVLTDLHYSPLLESASPPFHPVLASLRPESGSPPLQPVVAPACQALAIFLPLLAPMNPGGGRAGSCDRAACNPPGPTVNARPCCLDYNGPHLDGVPYNRGGGATPADRAACMAKGICNFVDSTCYVWSFLKANTPCGNEGALPWNLGGPTCFNNHKYRNCQALDETAFTFTPSSNIIGFGDTIELEVTNNTPKNATCLQVSGGPGKPKLKLASGYGKLQADSKKCRGYRLDHFSDKYKKHFETLAVTFTAPKAAKNTCRGDYEVVAEAGSLSKTSTVTATGGGCATAHFEFSLDGSEPIDNDTSHAIPPYTGHETGTETRSYRGAIDLKADNDSSKTFIRFLPVTGNVSGSWSISKVEQGQGENLQGCRYTKNYTFEVTVSGERNVRSEARDALGEWSATLSLDGNGAYVLQVPSPSVSMKGTDGFSDTTTVLTATCTGGGTSQRTDPREEDMVVSFETIRGTLSSASARSLTGSKPVTIDEGIGPPMTGTLTWRIRW